LTTVEWEARVTGARYNPATRVHVQGLLDANVAHFARKRLGAQDVYLPRAPEDVALTPVDIVIARMNAGQGEARLGTAGALRRALPLLAPVRVVVANILAPVLTELLPAIRGALSEDGRAVLAGMALDERPAMVEAIERGAWVIASEDIDAGSGVSGLDGEETSWWSVVVARS